MRVFRRRPDSETVAGAGGLPKQEESPDIGGLRGNVADVPEAGGSSRDKHGRPKDADGEQRPDIKEFNPEVYNSHVSESLLSEVATLRAKVAELEGREDNEELINLKRLRAIVIAYVTHRNDGVNPVATFTTLERFVRRYFL